jgi:pyruvate kinase
MVARGDLGLEIPLERVPRVQKEILRKARARGVPVIVATQVLESMRTEPRPTRAEASDAAGAVDGGADAIMLSGETATGMYPVRSVDVLNAIILDAESLFTPLVESAPPMGIDYVKALSEAAVSLSRRSNAHAIVAITREGKTAKLLSAIRPQALIVAVTDKPEVARVLALWHGVLPLVCDLDGETEQVIARVVESAVKRSGAAPDNAIMVVVNTATDLDRGSSNFVRIRRA